MRTLLSVAHEGRNHGTCTNGGIGGGCRGVSAATRGHSRKAGVVREHVPVHRDSAESVVISWHLRGSVDATLTAVSTTKQGGGGWGGWCHQVNRASRCADPSPKVWCARQTRTATGKSNLEMALDTDASCANNQPADKDAARLAGMAAAAAGFIAPQKPRP